MARSKGAASKDKGKVGEREFAALLREYGFEARRGQQFAGGGDSPDVVVKDLPGYHFEVKRVERMDWWAAHAQAKADAPRLSVPVVAHRPSRKPWVVMLEAEDFLMLLRELQQRDRANKRKP